MGIFTKGSHADDGDYFTKEALNDYREAAEALANGDRETAATYARQMQWDKKEAKAAFTKARNDRQR